MASAPSRDEAILYLVSCFRPKIRRGLQVERVLDYMPSLGAEVRERVRRVSQAQGDTAAADVLLGALQDEPRRPPGLCQEFAEALRLGGFQAAAYVDPSLEQLPTPSLEAAHETGARLLEIFMGRLVEELRAVQVAEQCVRLQLFQDEDLERVRVLCDTRGNPEAVRELLNRIERKKEWFSPFLAALREARHEEIANELSGQGTECYENGISADTSTTTEELKKGTDMEDSSASEENASFWEASSVAGALSVDLFCRSLAQLDPALEVTRDELYFLSDFHEAGKPPVPS